MLNRVDCFLEFCVRCHFAEGLEVIVERAYAVVNHLFGVVLPFVVALQVEVCQAADGCSVFCSREDDFCTKIALSNKKPFFFVVIWYGAVYGVQEEQIRFSGLCAHGK